MVSGEICRKRVSEGGDFRASLDLKFSVIQVQGEWAMKIGGLQPEFQPDFGDLLAIYSAEGGVGGFECVPCRGGQADWLL